MYKTDLDYQTLRKNIKPWGKSQMNTWRLYELNKEKPGYKSHGNVLKHFTKHGVTIDRMTDWDCPPVLSNGSTFGLQQQLHSSRPLVYNIREWNIYCDKTQDTRKTSDYIIQQTGDRTLSEDVNKSLMSFLGPMGWEKLRYSRFQQYAGERTLSHIDVHKQMSELHNSIEDPILCGEVRIGVIFFSDWAYGQGFALGKDVIQGWKAGDFYEWPWFFPHHTFNNSNVERNSLTVLGRKRLVPKS